MAARIYTIAQRKGGAGKTTLAIHLATSWAAGGKSVALVDIDPQGSLAAWSGMRQDAIAGDRLKGAGAALDVAALSGWRTGGAVDRLRSGHDVVVIDSPPHAETDAKVAVRAADMVLIPVQLNPLDLWASDATVRLAEAEKKPFLFVLNRVPARGRLGQEIRAELDRRKWPYAKQSLGNRQAFAASVNGGMGVAEAAPRSLAAGEADALAREVWRRFKG
ncbi:MAG: ParA family partition ATPase [Sneathiellaceae bacterium]